MMLHVFGAIVTAHGTAANNRGETEGNVTTLQKIVWDGRVHSTVSAEAIRFALRRRLAETEECNRQFDEGERTNTWKDPSFTGWSGKGKGPRYIDDDLLGFMAAEAAKEEGGKGATKVRRAVLEITRAISLTPWPGDVTFNAASPGATPSAQKKGSNPVPYGTEMHATRYQYGFALTPDTLDKRERAAVAIRGLCGLGEVAGNHGRFLFDFSPESVVFRLAQEAAPRILYSFVPDAAEKPTMPDLLRKVRAGDVKPAELVLGGAVVGLLSDADREALKGAALELGVKAACETACKRL
ncbi:MAG: type I-B CRISPR-associated protein Cas7/Cst2/DevR [Deltaproteobacteria bacterium]|nr:type I-B CRISPR-associated protein Cas7/Cst2/DevR [Deltaproteobacteria bacterium]